VAAPHYGLDGPANFEEQHWHLRVVKHLPLVARQLGLDLAECGRRLASARGKLLAAREARVRPGRDEKILASWNALMICGMARAARAFDRADWLHSAQRAADFVRATLWRDGRLHATHKDGRTHLNAYLDDHAFLLEALIELMQAQFRATDFDFARKIADTLLEHFEDREAGGFFFTRHDHEALIHRAKPGADNATPSGNGIAAFALQRLGHLAGEPRYLDAAARALALFAPALAEQPSAHVSLLAALDEHLEPPTVVIVRGPAVELVPWQRHLDGRYAPARLALAIPAGTPGLPAALDKPAGDAVNAWVCRGVTCLPPVATLAELDSALGKPAPDNG
jgi:uncharacterized protein YyaL (SSP411 family)